MVSMDQASAQTPAARLITIRGRVQGVGFRPFLFALAHACAVKGTVQNNMDGIRLVIEGEEASIQSFLSRLPAGAPRLSRMDSIEEHAIPPVGFADFTIIPSEAEGASALVLPIDAAICEECLQELYDPTNPRYRYPFLTCTQCGPRYTIIESLPYDRSAISMHMFMMCPLCLAEYEDPFNRRHHAQPIACPACGPQLSLYDMDAQKLTGDPLMQAAAFLRQGRIIAVKGIGGYHLVCNAADDQAVRQLRLRKLRPQKPLAIMVKSLEYVRLICELTEQEEQLLTSSEAPIVLLQKKETGSVADQLAPGMATLGVMLPYTPLHHLLLDELPYLVMTSANPTGLPMLHQEQAAFAYLKGIADYVLSHDREILHPADDSVVQVIRGEVDIIRRARGYAPDPIVSDHRVHGIHAVGAQQKNTFAIGRGQQIFLSPHIGDLLHIEMREHWSREHAHLTRWMGKPLCGAMDLHPQFEMEGLLRVPLVQIQHHHAHMVSCMEDNGMTEPCFGLILDGTGYGEDGNIWGFELLYGDAKACQRLGHLAYSPLPGGEQSIREPWRTAVSYLVQTFGVRGIELANELFPDKKRAIPILYHIIDKQLNTPLAGTCGRLFDAISALLGICEISTYEGEAAVKLSEMVRFEKRCSEAYTYVIQREEIWQLHMLPMLEEIVYDLRRGVPAKEIALRFHETVVRAAVELIEMSQKHSYNRSVVLSGGSFHNPYLRTYITQELKRRGYRVFSHKRVPCNDGGIALGQLVVAAAKGDR